MDSFHDDHYCCIHFCEIVPSVKSNNWAIATIRSRQRTGIIRFSCPTATDSFRTPQMLSSTGVKNSAKGRIRDHLDRASEKNRRVVKQSKQCCRFLGRWNQHRERHSRFSIARRCVGQQSPDLLRRVLLQRGGSTRVLAAKKPGAR